MSYVETSRLTPTELGKECDLLLAGSRSLYPSDHYALQADLRY